MSEVPQVQTSSATYENLTACCPICGRDTIYNRASDIKTLEPIGNIEVGCGWAECGARFRIFGDMANSAYEMIIFDCYELLKAKHYSYCILNLAQAFEVFFAQFFRVQLLYKSFAAEPTEDVDRLNRLMRQLYERTKRLSFRDMKNLFLMNLLYELPPTSLDESERIINRIPLRPADITTEELSKARTPADSRIRAALLQLQATKVPQLRNQIVHKAAYRPTLAEVNAALKETREILFPLARLLDMSIDDINWYTTRGGRTPA